MSLFERLEKARLVSAINARARTPEAPLSRTTESISSLSKNDPVMSPRDIVGKDGTLVALEEPLSKTTFTPLSSTMRRNLNQLIEIHARLPKRIILYRHAESAGNKDATAYACTPDHAVKLTQKGHKQAQEAGQRLAKDLRAKAEEEGVPPRVHFICSPYTRTLETMDGLIEALDNSEVVGVKTAVHLREQDFGNFQVSDRGHLTRGWTKHTLKLWSSIAGSRENVC